MFEDLLQFYTHWVDDSTLWVNYFETVLVICYRIVPVSNEIIVTAQVSCY